MLDQKEVLNEEEKENSSATSRLRLIVSDSFLSFMWVLSGSIIKYLVYMILGTGMDAISLLIKGVLAVVYLYYFSQLGKATNGGSYNPLFVLCYGISDSFMEFLYVVFGRIPAQVIGSVIAVWIINVAFPAAADGPCLNVDVNCGALIEGLLTFMIITLSLGIDKFSRSSKKTWISSVCKVVLHILGSDITGGIMNPASAFGWAYAQGKHLTKEHWCVYWLAPMEATSLIVWICSLFTKLPKQRRQPDVQYKDKFV